MTETCFRAIALSLMGAQTSSLNASGTPKPQNDAAGNASDDEEQQFQRDLQCAIEASKVESEERCAVASTQQTRTTHTRGTPTPLGSTTLLSERAQLEKERLARLKHYHGEGDDHENAGGQSQRPLVKRSRISSAEPTDRRVNQLQSSSFISSDSSSSSMHEKLESKTTGVQAVPVVDQLFWDGELRPTANKHSQPREDGQATFRLSEVLGPVRTHCCTLSSAR